MHLLTAAIKNKNSYC